MSDAEPLARWRVRRVDGPAPGVFALTLKPPAGASTETLLVTTSGWGLVEARPRGRPASAAVQLLRKHLAGGVIERLSADETEARLAARRGDRRAAIVLRADGGLTLEVDGRSHPLGHGPPAREPPPTELEALRVSGLRLARAASGGALTRARDALAKPLRREIAKLRRRLTKIEADRARVTEVEALRATGSALLAELHRLPPDAREVEVTDWTTDPPTPHRITLGPGRGPREEADARFARARKLERGAAIATERAHLTQEAVDTLDALLAQVESAGSVEALAPLRARAERHGVRPLEPAKRGPAPAPRRPYHLFRGAGDREILVGKTAQDNDALTLSAKPWDHWLHARGVAGSHVVVPLQRGESCPAELLVDAAHLAAHHSKLRGEARVEVTHVSRRHVRKPRGYPAGAVRVEREKVLTLRLEPERLARLIRSGRPA